MTSDQFDKLVRRLEPFAAANPQAYRTRVALLAALGYAYILLVLLIVVGLLLAIIFLMFSSGRGNAGGIKLIIILGILALVILRALWVTLPPPGGVPLRREDAPKLFDLVDELSHKLKTGRFEQILLTPEFNAAAAQRPRLGIFGWQMNYLLLGLPLMQGLSPEQFKSVVAHELGHLSGNHGRFGGWIYRLHRAWHQLLSALYESKGVAFIIFERFFRWYEPFFGAYSYVLRRQNEFEADRCAADHAGAHHAAHALMNVQIRGQQLEDRFWPKIYEGVNEQAVPPGNTFTAMGAALREPVPPEEAAVFLKEGMADREGSDSHPPLADRISAFGFPDLRDRLSALEHSGPLPDAESVAGLPLPPAPDQFAAEYYLRESLPDLVRRFDTEWKQSIAPTWAERHNYVQESLAELARLDERARSEKLDEEDAWNRARWTAELRTEAEAIPLFREILKANPADTRSSYMLGQILLTAQDQSGIALIEEAMKNEPDAVLPGCEAIYRFHLRNGRAEEAEQYTKRAREHYEELGLASGERQGVSVRDRFEPHGLNTEIISALKDQIAANDGVVAAHLVRKIVKHLPEKPFFVLAVQPSSKWYKFRSEDADSKLVGELMERLTFPGEAFVLTTTGGNSSAAKKIRKVPGAEIYRR